MSEAKDNKQANTPVGAKCRGCSSSIAKEHAQCTNCQSYYHPSCAKQAVPLSGGIFQRCCGRRGSASTSDEIRDMLKLEMLALRKDFKNDIKIELAPVITSVNGLKSQVQTFTEQFQKRISSIENKVTELDTRIELNANTINTNNEKITELTNRIFETQCLNDNIVLLREVDDQMARRNNALFLGINEPNSVSSSERLSNDLSQVQGICDTLVNKVEIVSCFRIGKFSSESLHPRPIKVTFANYISVDQIISGLIKAKRTKNFLLPVKNLSTVHDRTVLQRKEQKLVQQQLQERIAAGEKNLKIVSRNGQPIIVQGRQNTSVSTPRASTT
ncbi:uncharacterized protein LOC123270798 [Cotesia glomerata]|uniref:uncharacterized protein LOC123270798 n=1 Tax=Cotesia glomerata TaxID=32391 RepID=UPI001D00F334|nr:uncharacterized protein LOC123270798 [Cotesia glomerata]